jgi:CHASE2 domain-containing sensor protein
MTEEPKTGTILVRVRRAILRPLALSVFLLVGLWNISVSSSILSRSLEGEGAIRETLQDLRSVNLHIQLRLYNWLTLGRPIPLKNDYVTLVYIDDDTHWTRLSGSLPTNRPFLAKLIRNLSEPPTQAAVIGLDIQLLAPRTISESLADQSQAADDAELLSAIQDAAAKGVPVILGGAFVERGQESFHIPDLFTAAQLAPPPEKIDCTKASCPDFGFVNGPEDKRLIPLTRMLKSESGTQGPMDSFALAIAKAYIGPLAAKSPSSGLAFQSDAAIFGSFLPEAKFRSVSALNVEYRDSEALGQCAKKIVIVGSHWHELQGYGDLVDTHLSPVGAMSGLAFHASFVESLLQHQFAQEPPLWVGVVIDLIVGLIIYTSFELAAGWRTLLVLCLAFLVPLAGAYIFLVTANLYLDFFFPIELYFFHILYEVISEYVTWKRRQRTEAGPSTQISPPER